MVHVENINKIDAVIDDIRKVIDFAAEERIDSRGKWIDQIAEWISNCPYCKSNGLKGVEGVYQFCEDKMSIDMYLLDRLGINHTIIERKV